MPLYMDIHSIDGPVSIDDVANAHAADLQTHPSSTCTTCATG
jgi:hypothetical protein